MSRLETSRGVDECGSPDTSEGSKNSRSFEDSRRSDEEDSEDGALSKEEGSETLQVDDILAAGSDMAEFNKPNWAKLVRVLISEGSLSLLKILRTKSLAEMFTMLVMKEKLKLCIASTGLRDNQLTESRTGHAGWHDLEVWHDRVVWHEPEQFSSELNNISPV
ncbi:hypothetical protein Tco_1008124 [Tanacetum coccineum]